MILAAQYARVHRIPYLGICLGMQMAIVEFVRHVLGYEDANSIELAPSTGHPVIALMPDQEKWRIWEELCGWEVIPVFLQRAPEQRRFWNKGDQGTPQTPL